MKKFFLTTATVLALGFLSFAAPPSEVNEKVLAAFSKTFQNANQVVWSEYTDHYEVRFVYGAIDTRVKYDMQGNIMESVRYYKENDLPLFIKSKIQNKYAGKKVFGVTEMAKDSELTYYIILEDDKNWVTVKSDYFGNMSIFQKFRKG